MYFQETCSTRKSSATKPNTWWLKSSTPLSAESYPAGHSQTGQAHHYKHKESQLPKSTMPNTTASVPEPDKGLWLRLHRQPNSDPFSTNWSFDQSHQFCSIKQILDIQIYQNNCYLSKSQIQGSVHY